jgi:type I restriction enzyme S subunit
MDAMKTLLPKLRFPEFQDAPVWEKKSIGSVCQSFSGGTPLTSEKDFYGGEIPFIRSAEIDKERTELFLTQKGFENSSAKLVKTGDVLVALYGANSGDVALAKLDGAINQAILCLKSEGSNPFIYQFLYYKKDWLVSNYIQGGQGNLSGEIIKSIRLPFPDVTEQQKIADCLTSLDDLIVTQRQKMEALGAYKKGLMQNLFPAEGESVPRLRFPEFESAGEWKEEKLGNISFFINERFSLEKLTLDNYISTENILPDYMGVTRATKLPPSGSAIKFKVNDILISNIRPYLKKVWLSNKDGGASNDVIVVRAKEKITAEYLSFMLVNDVFIEYVMKGAKGVKMPRGDISLMKEYPLAYPSIPEQQRISELLTTIDEQISAQSEVVAGLKVHKKGLMQGLFPSMDEVQE